jgi:hypothetical protein
MPEMEYLHLTTTPTEPLKLNVWNIYHRYLINASYLNSALPENVNRYGLLNYR